MSLGLDNLAEVVDAELDFSGPPHILKYLQSKKKNCALMPHITSTKSEGQGN